MEGREAIKSMTRRSFVRGAAAVVLGAALASSGVAAFAPDDAQAAATRKCYTISAANTPVYGNTGLTNRIGAIFGSDEVSVITVTGSYSKVSYPTSRGAKTGYIPTSAILTATGGTTYTSSAKFTTYKRPGGASYGYVAKGDRVLALGSSGSYTQLKYPVNGGYKYAFAPTSSVNAYLRGGSSTSNASSTSNSTLAWYQARVGRVIANTGSYKTYLDGTTAIKGQCVWYVRNRGYEKLGARGLTGISGNANTWWSKAASKGKSRGTTPRANSIACWNGGRYGHVAYVEYYDPASSTVYFTEGNWPGSANGVLKRMSLAAFKSHVSSYKGCIYL